MKLEPITPADYPRLKKFFQRQKYGLCAYSLSYILIWTGKIYQPYGAVDGDALIVGAEFDATHEENRHLILPISPSREYSPEQLHDAALKLGFERYWFVPEEYIEKFGTSRLEKLFEIEEQPELHDYIYLKSDLAELRGNKYAKKRNLIKQFEREYAQSVQIEEIVPGVVPECIDFLEEWCKQRDCDADPESDLSCEKLGAINMLENIELLEAKGLFLRIDGVISAFGIVSQITEEMGGMHFQKAFAHIKGLYQFFDRVCAGRLFQGYKYVNKEGDMGEPGLAKAKKSYHPVMILKSYKLVIR
jgi:hypothetical protein